VHAPPVSGAGRSSFQALQDAQAKLADAQVEAARLAIELTRLRALQRTIGIARHNLALDAPAPAPGQQTSAAQLFDRDQALAAWLDGQIEQDAGYAEAAVQRAREAQNVTQLRLQQAQTQLTRAQNRVALLQTSLISSMLAGLTVVSVLHIQLPIDPRVNGPVVVAFVSLLLALPTLAAHWYERYAGVDRMAAALCGAAIGWLVGSAVTLDPSAPLALGAAVVGAAVARVLTEAHDRWLATSLQRMET
jgi:CASPASE and TPR Repeat-Associated C-terminal domain